MPMLKDFKAFIMRGNVLDLAVAVIIGTAFGKIVSSFVADILMPFINALVGGSGLGNLKIRLAGDEGEQIFLTYGVFLKATIDFLIIAAVIFLMVRIIHKMQKPAVATTKPCPRCTMDVSLAATRCPHCTSEIT